MASKYDHGAADETARTILLCPNEDDLVNLSASYIALAARVAELEATLAAITGHIDALWSEAEHGTPLDWSKESGEIMELAESALINKGDHEPRYPTPLPETVGARSKPV